MTIAFAHPSCNIVRSLFTLTNRSGSLQLLHNPDGVVRQDWEWFFGVGSLYVTRVKL